MMEKMMMVMAMQMLMFGNGVICDIYDVIYYNNTVKKSVQNESAWPSNLSFALLINYN